MAERAHPEDPGFQEGSPYRANLFKRYAFASKFTKGKTVLDIPCGVGWGTSLLEGKYRVGIDICADAIAYAKEHYLGINFLVGDMANIPLQDKSVDVVVCLEGFEHVSRATGMKFLDEAVRVIKNNGLLVMTVPVILPGGKHSSNRYHLHEPALSDLKNILAQKFCTQYFKIVDGPDGPVVYFIGSPQSKTNMLKFSYEERNIKYPRKSISNILFTTSAAPAQSPFSTKEKRPPIGIGFLISVLRNAGHRVFFIDNYLRPDNFLETDYLQKNEIDYVGIYANTICFRDTLRMLYKLQDLRQQNLWKGKIIVGGPHTTVAVNTIPDFVDYIVQGEAEQAILDIVEGKVTDRVIRYPRIGNLDSLPMPAWDYFIDLPYDWGVTFFEEKPVFTMNTSRGCPFKCAFCSVGSIWGKKYTCFSAERIVSDIEYLIEHYGAKGIYFREDNFTLDEARLRKFCNLLIEKKINISWVCESRVSSLSRELVRLMAKAGAKGIYFGVETGSQRILDFLKKGISVKQIEESFSWCHELGLKTAASIIVGVPGETSTDQHQTRDLLKRISPDITWFNIFVGIPDSDLYRFTLDNRLYEYIDDRGLVYLPEHNSRVDQYYKSSWNAYIPDTEQTKDWTMKPKVSILMSAYNCRKYLKQALKSIYHQTFQDFEIVIVDDGSTDATAEILINMKDSRTFIYRNPKNIGLTKSLNMGLKLCRGEYIARMDADDISDPERFAKQVDFLDKNPDCAIVGSAYYQIDQDGKIVSHIDVLTGDDKIRKGLQAKNWFGHGTVMIRRSVLLELGGYDEKFEFAQDYDLWLRVSEKYKLANIGEPLYFWRSDGNNISNAKGQQQRYYKDLALSEARKRKKLPSLCVNKTCANQDDFTPMVSVVVPTYNRPAWLANALKSILAQTYQNFEIIVVNDAGQDVKPIIDDLQAGQKIVYITHDENKGLAAARNTAIRSAKGKYIAYLDDDDVYLPEHLETLCNVLKSSDYKVAYTDAYRAYQKQVDGTYIVTQRTIPFSFDVSHDKLLVRNLLPVLCIMHEKACLDEVGHFDETLATHEDWDLWIRLSRRFEFMHIKKATAEVSWRTDGSSMTSRMNALFLTIAKIHKKYCDYAVNKPNVIKQQNEFVEALKQQYQQSNLYQTTRETSSSNTEGQTVSSRAASIIIPVFNKAEYTEQCLKSLIKNTQDIPYEVIIVDNGSTDETKDLLNSICGSIKVISNQDNLGFAKACNQAAAVAKGNYLVFLNNATEVQAGWLKELIDILQSDDEVAAVGSKLLYSDGTIQHAGVVILDNQDVNSLLPRYCFMHEPSDGDVTNSIMTFQAVTAACMAVRRLDFEKVNGFDENYSNGCEDVDFCFKLIQTGRKIIYQPQSVITCYESKSGSERFKAIEQNNDLLQERWAGKIIPDLIIKDNQVHEGPSQAIQPYLKGKEGDFNTASRTRDVNALISWVERYFLSSDEKPPKGLKFAVKTCTPSDKHIGWGDTDFANNLAKALNSLGHSSTVHKKDQWNQPDEDIDIVIHIKGLFRYHPKPYNFNILWLISHPELLTLDEINQFDIIFCASKFYLQYLKSKVTVPCFYLQQATDEQVFNLSKNNPVKDIDVLFIGNNYYQKGMRKIVQDLFSTGKQYNLRVAGLDWRNVLDDKYVLADFVQWNELPKLYSRAKIVLNDHQETMRQFGFINNRTFDLAALGAFQISDYVKNMEEFEIVTYKDPEDLRQKLDYFLNNEQEREKIAQLNNRLCRDHTFRNVAEKILDVLNEDFRGNLHQRIKNRAAHLQNKTVPSLKAPGCVEPKVSIVTTCYNAEKFLPECLDSIINQTMDQWELFLIDDGSTDGTKQIIEKFSQMDKRIKPYYFPENKGPYTRRNFAVQQANSDFIVVHDADDIMCPDKLKVLYSEIIKEETLAVVGSFYWTFLNEFKSFQYAEQNELPLRHEEIADRFYTWRYAVNQGSAIIRKRLFSEIGPYDENPFDADAFWFAKLAEFARYSEDVKFKNIDQYLTIVRLHPHSQMQQLSIIDPRGRRMLYRRYCQSNLKKIRQRIESSFDIDIKSELKSCQSFDFLTRFSADIPRWESEPLDHNHIQRLLNTAVLLFNKGAFVSCIVTLGGIEAMIPDAAVRFKNFNLLRAMACFAIDMEKKCQEFLNREIHDHNNIAAEVFLDECHNNQPQIDVLKWCSDNNSLYGLQMVDVSEACR